MYYASMFFMVNLFFKDRIMKMRNKVALVTGAAVGFKSGGPSIGWEIMGTPMILCFSRNIV